MANLHGDVPDGELLKTEPHLDVKALKQHNSCAPKRAQATRNPVRVDLTKDEDKSHSKRSASEARASVEAAKRPKLSHEPDHSFQDPAGMAARQSSMPAIFHYNHRYDGIVSHGGSVKTENVDQPDFQSRAAIEQNSGTVQPDTAHMGKRSAGGIHYASDARQSLQSFQQELETHEREFQARIQDFEAKIRQQAAELESKTEEANHERQEKEHQQKQVNALRARLDKKERNEGLIKEYESKLSTATERCKDVEESLKKSEKLEKAALLVTENVASTSKEQKKEITKLKKELREAKKEAKGICEEHEKKEARLRTDIEKIESGHEVQLDRLNKREKDLLNVIRDLQGLSQRHNFQVSDEELIEKWGLLQHKIGQMVNAYARPIEGIDVRDFASICKWRFSDASALFSSRILCVYAFEAYIWVWLGRVVFDDVSDAWAGQLGSTLGSLVDETAKALRNSNDELMPEMQSWRSASAQLFSRLSQRSYNHESHRGVIQELVDYLGKFLQFDEASRQRATADALAIFHDARSFDIARRKLKADIKIVDAVNDKNDKFVAHGAPIQSRYMRDRSPGALTRQVQNISDVKLIISPAVVRYGNSSGTGYDVGKCLVKMDVLCDIRLIPEHQPPAKANLLSHNQAEAEEQTGPSSVPGDESVDNGAQVGKGFDQQDTQDSNNSNASIMTPPVVANVSSVPYDRPALARSSNSTRMSRGPRRASAVKARGSLAETYHDTDELAEDPDAYSGQAQDSNGPGIVKRRDRDDEDKAYVPG